MHATTFNSPFWPVYPPDTIAAAVRVLESGRTNQWGGCECKAFQAEFSDWLGVKNAVAVANGSVALETAWHILDLKLLDEVLTTCRTFYASVGSILQGNAVPVFVDVDELTQNIDPAKIEAAITPQTKAILCVHHAGCPCEMESILEIARRHQLFVVEDCAQAIGARYRGQMVGTFGDVGCFSFCQDKIFSTGGEGGMVVCQDDALLEKAWSYKDHGRNRTKIEALTWKPRFPYYCDSLGTNLRMTEMQAAIGRVQLRHVNQWIEMRRDNASRLDVCLGHYPFIRVPVYPPHLFHPFYEYYAFVIPELLPTSWSHQRILETFHERGIPCNVGSCPEVYLEEAFDEVRYPDGTKRKLRPPEPLPIAKRLGETSLKFLVHPALLGTPMNEMIGAITTLLRECQ
jgi:dTDP-4-amino-4,6-dideoxygalactose transaminase